jgi:pyridoxine/pyridoxamine 5'-phosphate oxidase
MNLKQAWNKVLSHLRSAPDDADSAFRYPSVATKALEGNPVQRTVVLREVTPDYRLLFFTDFRSRKVLQIRHSPELNLLFYDHEYRIQLLVNGKAILHMNDEKSRKQWNDSGSKNSESYASVKAPGVTLSKPEEAFEYHDPAIENFCVVEVKPYQMEFLQLRKEGHLRSSWPIGNNQDAKHWIAP